MNASRTTPLSRRTILHAVVVAVAALLLTGASLPLLAREPDESENNFTLTGEAARQFVNRFDAIFNGPHVDIADELFSEDFTGHLPLAPELDRDGWKAYVESFYAAFPDTTQQVNEVVVGENRVVLYVTYRGTHQGEFMGVAATGREITMNGMGIFRFNEAGKAVENFAVLDIAGVMTQIGALSLSNPE